MKTISIILTLLCMVQPARSQPAPASDENIPALMTFGGDSDPSWGDDDFLQIFFFLVPPSQATPVYLRIYDPDTGGALDEVKGNFNTTVSFSVYGGPGCWSDTAAQSILPGGNFRSGYLMASQEFSADPAYDRNWFTFGPFNPSEGEYSEKFKGRVFKVIAQGVSGDDGNIYRYFLSTDPQQNIPVEGGNLFTYKYHFRLPDRQDEVCQVYPFIDERTISVEISNFDWDNDGIIRIFSVSKNGVNCDISGENNWVVRKFDVTAEEKNSTMEIQFIKNKKELVRNNNVVLAVRNQYGASMPFYVIPLGGVPVYSPRIKMK